ncbi:hypothetical protein K493DRAFT_408083 [Basidiobolus meristosporus CBS 931.73]|uniref:PEHE domain-containing protein n=1 Tax=Basidiobolus meristosporus CBS 931.73 TaxID=1314790 RepID=A0A1Y1Y890_9FUNG|nr:hypothetical protein K493DRAFT_408083 [Basidiobolus meristosporus CBS 931.73]|eukprot:ORX94189.1 hypothetical protein K493DRAFT_408083 [Basidiobolus meristosporus CBS 931.73]
MKTRLQPKPPSETRQPRKKPDKVVQKGVKSKPPSEKPKSRPEKRKRKSREQPPLDTSTDLPAPVEMAKIKEPSAKSTKKPSKTPPTEPIQPLKKSKSSSKLNTKEKSKHKEALILNENIEEENVVPSEPQAKKPRQKPAEIKRKASEAPDKSAKKPANKQKSPKHSEKPIPPQEKVQKGILVSTLAPEAIVPDEPARESNAKEISKKSTDERIEPNIPKDKAILEECQINEDVGGEYEEQVRVTNMDIEIPHFVPIDITAGNIRRSRRKQHLEPENMEDISNAAYEKRHRKHELTEKKMKNREQELLAHQEYKKRLMMEELHHLKINKRTRTNRMSHVPRQRANDPTSEAAPTSVEPPAPTPNIMDSYILLATIKRHSITRRANEVPLVLPNPLFFQVDFDLPRTYDTLKRRKGSS